MKVGIEIRTRISNYAYRVIQMCAQNMGDRGS